MSRVTLQQLQAGVASFVTQAKISNPTYTATANNLVGLLDKIGKIVHIEQSLQSDKLNMFDGEYLSFGKKIEEWEQDLYPVADYDPTGAGALTPDYPNYRPVFYSETLGRKRIKVSIKYNDVERAVNNTEQFIEVISTQYKRIEDSFAQWRYAVKREMLAKLIAKAEGFMNGTADEYDGVFDPTGDYDIGAVVANASPATAYYIVFKPYDNDEATLADAIASGYLVQLDLVTELAQPTDTSTGEAFIEQLKKDVEIAQDSSQGHSLNGNALGVQETLVLIVKQGIRPALDVQTLAGAFQVDKLAIPTEIVTVKDFGSDASGAYAVLMDKRGMRLHPTYNATRENPNGDGDFLNVFKHTENTAYISRNTFLKVYKNPA